VQHQHVGGIDRARDRQHVLERIKWQLLVEAGIDGKRGDGAHQYGVAVGVGARGDLGRDVAGRARAVIDDDLLAQSLGKLGAHGARGGVGAATRGEADQHADRLVRILGGGRCERRQHAGEGDGLDEFVHAVFLLI
jgi:hypothetical protein